MLAMPYISDEPTFELVWKGASPGVEEVVEGISVEIGHPGHVEIRKPADKLLRNVSGTELSTTS